jgi:ABC-type glutathione transport system ATPase component
MTANETMTTPPAVAADGLNVHYLTKHGVVDAVRDTSVVVHPGEAVGIVGESGSGKSTLAAACIGMLQVRMLNRTPVEFDGTLRIVGHEVAGLTGRGWQNVRGRRVGYVGQDPFAALNPVLRVRQHMSEALRHRPKRDRERLAIDLLHAVELPPETMAAFPHELSGGMRQRVAIAMGVADSPELLIADEPTTALDVTTQAEILKLLGTLRSRTGMALLLISHDLGVIGQVCDRIYVMYDGRVVEDGSTEQVLYSPQHPYTRGLLKCARLERDSSGYFEEGMRRSRPAEGGPTFEGEAQ